MAPTGALLMLGAAVSWAIGTVLIKRFTWHPMPVMALTGWQLLIGGVPIVIGWWLWEPVPDLGALSLPSAIGLAYAVLVAMIFCQTAYFKIVTLVPASVAAMAVMAVPVVGVLTSAWVLGEPVGLIEAAALVLVVGGLFRPGPARRRAAQGLAAATTVDMCARALLTGRRPASASTPATSWRT